MNAPSFVTVTALSVVEPEDVLWLWPARIPLGKITVLDGDPDLGKTLILSGDIAARVTTGRGMPDGAYGDLDGPASVVLIAPEDGLADTIRPRFDAAGGDSERFFVIEGIGDDNYPIQLPDHVNIIEDVVNRYEAKLVIVDSIMATLSGDTNSYRDQDIRHALSPVAQMAERTGVAVCLIRHLNKSGGSKAIYRGGGSIGLIGIARAGMLVGLDPDDDSGERRILVNVKNNLTVRPPALAYRIVAASNHAPRVEWLGATTHTANELVSQSNAGDDRANGDVTQGNARDEAKMFLIDILGNGPRPVKEIFKEAKDADIAVKTLRRAKDDLGIDKVKEGFGDTGRWVWQLPEMPKMATSSLRYPSKTEGILDESGHLSSNGHHPEKSSQRFCPRCEEWGVQTLIPLATMKHCHDCARELEEVAS